MNRTPGSGRSMASVRRRAGWALTAGVACGAVLVAPVSAAATGWTTVADWEMNEATKVNGMVDSSGAGLTGKIGSSSALVVGQTTDGANGYKFTQRSTTVDSGRLVTVSSDALNPGGGSFAATIRIKTGAGDQNIMQKGQATTSGGYWKIDMVQGVPICLFRDSAGVTSARGWGAALNPSPVHTFHTIRCALDRGPTDGTDAVSISVDGVSKTNSTKKLGTVGNTSVLSIGGKASCGGTVGCDYFVGFFDYATIQKGSAAS